MKAVHHEYYCVYEAYDRSHFDIAFFNTQEEAQIFAKESPHYGVCPRTTSLTIWDSVEEYQEIGVKGALREKALAKLTKEEKEVLGL